MTLGLITKTTSSYNAISGIYRGNSQSDSTAHSAEWSGFLHRPIEECSCFVYIELTLDDSSSNVEHTLDDPGSYSREKKDDVGSNLEQSQDGRSSHHKLTQDDWGVAQDERYSDPKPTQDGNDYLLR